MNNEQKLYTPGEAAKKLGISVTMLRYYRLTGRVEGTSLGNTTVYTEKQLRNVDRTKRTPGPKKVKGEDDPEGFPTSVMLMLQTAACLEVAV